MIFFIAAAAALTLDKQVDRLTAHCANNDLNQVYACEQDVHDKLEARLRSLYSRLIDRTRREDRAYYEDRRKYEPTYVFHNDGVSTAKAAEDAWFAWRDAQCKYETYDLFQDGASVAGSMLNDCSMKLMLQRIDELNAELKRGAK